MKKGKNRVWLLLVAVALVLLFVTPALAQAPQAKKAVLVSEIRLRAKTISTVLTGGRAHTVDLARGMSILPANADNGQIVWNSSNPLVATVDAQSGMVTLKGEGSAVITAKSADGSGAQTSMTVKAKVVRVTKLTLSASVVTLNPGEQYSIGTTVKPAKATYPEPRFSSSDTSIATVDERGVVSARSAGVATITVYVDQAPKEKKATCKIQVRSSNPRSFSLSAVGDVIVGGDPARGTLATFKKYLAKYAAESGDPFTGMLINAARYFNQTDLTLANLECTLTTSNSEKKGKGGKRPKYLFKGKPEYANILVRGGINVLNLSNNHTIDYGTTGYNSTKRAMNNVGLNWNGTGYKESKVVNVNGLDVGFIGFRTGLSPGTVSGIKRDVAKLRNECDVLVVSLHFGDVKEYTFKVTGKQKSYARAAINAGADLVVGHHPHVISGMEFYKGRNIVYGLGSFLSVGPNPSRPRRTFIYQQEFKVHPGFTEPANTKVVPFWISSTNKTNDMRPTYAPGTEAATIGKMIDKYSVGTPVNYTLVGP